jgi:hypothetical protein
MGLDSEASSSRRKRGTECRAVSNGATLVPNRDPLNFPFPEPS